MPTLPYSYVHPQPGWPGPTTCGVGPAAGLINPGPLVGAWAALYNAQLTLGIFAPGWEAWEQMWRVSSFQLGACEAPGLGGMSPSPVVLSMDATERGQLAYHVGTGSGLAAALGLLNPGGAGARYFPFHLTRAQAAGAVFNFGVVQRPDLVLFSFDPLAAVLHHFVVWECKGHAANVGQAPLGPALGQSRALLNMTSFVGGAVLPVPRVPAAYVASQIDLAGAGLSYRLQTTDPPNDGNHSLEASAGDADGFLRSFYAPYLAVLAVPTASSRTYEEIRFRTVEVVPHVRFGVDQRIVDALTDGSTRPLHVRIGEILNQGYSNGSDDRFISTTGLLAELGSGWRRPSVELPTQWRGTTESPS